MSLNLLKPIYPYRPISSPRSLAAALRVSEQELRDIAATADGMYRTVKPKPGSNRQTFDANAPLKRLHARIKGAILSRVVFPDYLTGSLAGRDYKTNASLHTNKAVVICEDVKGFFNSVSAPLVYDIWGGFFRFDPAVATLLTQLTTKDGALPQGGIPSSFIANLAFWRHEPLLHAKLHAMGVTYSRYVDDIAMSSRSPLGPGEKTKLIAEVYGMLRKHGLYAKREKHEIMPATQPMITTKLIVNRKAALPQKRRSKVRAAVFQAEQMAHTGVDAAIVAKALNNAASQVGLLGRFHPNLSTPLKARVKAARSTLPSVDAGPIVTGGAVEPDGDSKTPPWNVLE